MPVTILEIFKKFGISPIHRTRWGECICDTRAGIYIVSLSSEIRRNNDLLQEPIFNDHEISKWIEKIPSFTIDKKKASIQTIKERLKQFWLPDESILYIGKVKRANQTGLGVRIHEYFETEIGDRGPHSGGQWIKVLKNINSLNVFYGHADDPKDIEDKMLTFFRERVSNKTKNLLFYIPFANIRHHGDKKHGMKNQRLKNQTTANKLATDHTE